MGIYPTTGLKSVQKAMFSTIRKTEKARETLSKKQTPDSPLLTLVSQRLKAYDIGSSLIAKAPKEDDSNNYSKEEFEDAATTIPLLIREIEKVLPKFKIGTSQHTLAIRRIKVFNLILALLEKNCRVKDKQKRFVWLIYLIVGGKMSKGCLEGNTNRCVYFLIEN